MSTQKRLQPLVFTHTKDSILQETKEAIEYSRTNIKKLCQNVKAEDATFRTVIDALLSNKDILWNKRNHLSFYSYVSTNEKIRDVSAEAEKTFDDYAREIYSSEDLFKLVDAVYKNPDKEKLDKDLQLLLNDTYLDFLGEGIGLPAGSTRNVFLGIKKRIKDLEVDFAKNLNNETTGLWLTKEQLAGVPSDIVDELQKGENENKGKVWLTMKMPHYMPTMQYAHNDKTRRQVYLCRESVCPENVEIFEQIVALRDEAARMLGYPSHATFRLERKMAKTPETVNNFLSDIHSKLQNGGKNEIEVLKALKKAHVEKQGKTFDNKYYIWDHNYYNQIMEKEQYSVDHLKLAEYFPLQTTLTKMFDIFAKSFGIVFNAVEGDERDKLSPTGNGKDISWHEDVQIFRLWDDKSEGGEFLGYLYLDLFPRDGKYGHAMIKPIRDGFVRDGNRQHPIACLLSNFTKPTTKKPSLLKHNEVTTLFHELGHCLHSLVSRTKYGVVHGINVKWDFVEAPSQMLEHWVWEFSQLKYFSNHYSYLSSEYRRSWEEENNKDEKQQQQPPKELPDDMIQNLIRSKNVNSALFYLRQLRFGIFDMRLHNVKSHEDIVNMDIQGLFNSLVKEICLLDTPEDEGEGIHWAHGFTSFGHLVFGGYDAGYYGYLYSQVFAADMFYTAFKNNLTSTETGKRYRYTVLEKGGSQDPMEILEAFLGRKPQPDAFYKDIGLKA